MFKVSPKLGSKFILTCLLTLLLVGLFRNYLFIYVFSLFQRNDSTLYFTIRSNSTFQTVEDCSILDWNWHCPYMYIKLWTSEHSNLVFTLPPYPQANWICFLSETVCTREHYCVKLMNKCTLFCVPLWTSERCISFHTYIICWLSQTICTREHYCSRIHKPYEQVNIILFSLWTSERYVVYLMSMLTVFWLPYEQVDVILFTLWTSGRCFVYLMNKGPLFCLPYEQVNITLFTIWTSEHFVYLMNKLTLLCIPYEQVNITFTLYEQVSDHYFAYIMNKWTLLCLPYEQVNIIVFTLWTSEPYFVYTLKPYAHYKILNIYVYILESSYEHYFAYTLKPYVQVNTINFMYTKHLCKLTFLNLHESKVSFLNVMKK